MSRYYGEELFQLSEWDRELVMQDNGAITFFLLGTDCFSIGSGIVPRDIRMLGTCAVPIMDVPPSTIIWVKRQNHALSVVAQRFISLCEEEFFTNIPRISCQ